MPSRTKLCILVVDDDEDICLYLKEFLTREGYSVITATKPLDALPEVVDGKCQLALIDVRMPQMDGVEFLRKIRSITPDLCVILMTAYPSVEGAVDSMKADAFDYLLKPFELDQLRQVIQRAVRERGLLIDAEMRVNRLVGARIRTVRKDRSMTLRHLALGRLESLRRCSRPRSSARSTSRTGRGAFAMRWAPTPRSSSWSETSSRGSVRCSSTSYASAG